MANARCGRAIRKYMTEVAPASGTSHFHPNHAVRQIPMLRHCIWRNRGVKTGPTAVPIKLGIRLIQGLATSLAAINAGLKVVIQFGGKWTLSP